MIDLNIVAASEEVGPFPISSLPLCRTTARTTKVVRSTPSLGADPGKLALIVVITSDLPGGRSPVRDELKAETILQTRTTKETSPDVDESKVMRKIDIRVVPVLCLMYFLAFLDRSVNLNVASFAL